MTQIREIKQALKKVVYRSEDWHALCLLLAQKLVLEGDYSDSKMYASKVDKSKLADEYKATYDTLFAQFAEEMGDPEKTIECLRAAKAADRALAKPIQQFAITKQIAWTLDSLERWDEAISEWKQLIQDFENFEHSEHQPMFAYKFVAQTLIKAGKPEEAAAAKLEWVNSRVAKLQELQKDDLFQSKDPPPQYNDEMSNYFERSRQNVLNFWEHQTDLVKTINERSTQFWVGSESMRVGMADLQDAKGDQNLSDEEQLPYFFFMRALNTYLTSIELAAGGRIPEAFGALRMCLENSFYAYQLADKPEDAAIWLDRPTLGIGETDSAKVAKRMLIARTFSPGKIITNIGAVSDDLGKQCRFFYEMSIDEGAHPNVDIFRRQASQRQDGTTYIFGVDFLTASQSPETCKTILSATQSVLQIFRLAKWIW